MTPRKRHPALIRLSSWEYWPMWLTNIPVVIFWFINAILARSFTFFTAVNPGLYMGGLFGTSKEKINSLIPCEYLPRTLYLDPTSSGVEKVLADMADAGIKFPVIVKPDIGERGLSVVKTESAEQLASVLTEFKHKVMIQEYIDYNLEFSVLCYRFPDRERSGITSVCIKEFLSVTGDGESSIRELMTLNDRAVLQLPRLERTLDVNRVPAAGEVVVLEHVGNHNRGTKFLNGNHLITREMEQSYLAILSRMRNVHYGRFDLKARSEEDFIKARDIRVLEFNGVNSEPVHIYDPEYPVWKAYRDLWQHWSILRRIALAKCENGTEPAPLRESWQAMRTHLDYQRALRAQN